MAQLAIKGHATRGREVIEILKMLGGRKTGYGGLGSQYYYYMDECGNITGTTELPNSKTFVTYTLEEFLEKFLYRVGDKVMTDDGDKANIVGMIWDDDINDVFYEIQICNEVFKYPKELLQPYKEETMRKDKNDWAKWDLPDGYEFQDKEGNVINTDVIKLVKIQPQYPKTYEECWGVLNPNDERYIDIDVPLDYNKLLFAFTELLICRKAYWKIAGDEMGLDKPWEPDWSTEDEIKYVIEVYRDNVRKNSQGYSNTILAFPTSGMRDAFYENFKDLIEICKEFL